MCSRTLFLAAAAAAALAGGSRVSRAQVVRTVTLAEALQLAAQSQPAIVQVRQNVRVADAQQRQAVAAFLPSVTANVSTSTTGGSRLNQFGMPTAVASFYSSSLGLTASWDLFTGFRRGAQRSSARATSDQYQATLLLQQYAIALATKQAYYAALEASELVGVQQTQLHLAGEQLKLTSERLRLGATTRSDSLRAMVTQANAQLAVINAQNTLRTAQANLARAIQLPGLVMALPDTALEARITVLDTAGLIRDAEAGAPSVRQADAVVAVDEAQRAVSRSSFLPTANLSLGNTWAAGQAPGQIQRIDTTVTPHDTTFVPATTGPFTGTYASGWNARLTISYPIFNNLSRETGFVTADANLQSAIASARDARLALQANLLTQLSALSSAAASIDVSRASVVAAQEDLRMQTERYRLGAVTIIEVLTSQASLQQAQVNLVTARYNYLVAHAQLEALVGHTL